MRALCSTSTASLLFVLTAACAPPEPEPSPYCTLAPVIEVRDLTWQNRTFADDPFAIDAESIDVFMRPTGDGTVRVLVHPSGIGAYSSAEFAVSVGFPRGSVGEVLSEGESAEMIVVDDCSLSFVPSISTVVRSQTGEAIGPPDWVTDDFEQLTEVTVDLDLNGAAGSFFGESCVRPGEGRLAFALYRSAAGYAPLRDEGCMQDIEE